MRKMLLIIGIIGLVGCVTASGRVGARLLQKHTEKAATENPTEENKSANRLATGVARQVGAPAEAPEPTAENMNAVCDQMEVEEQTWENVKGFFANLLSKLPSGVGEGILGGITILASIVAFFKNKKATQAVAALTTTISTANDVKHIAEGVISGDSKIKLEDAVAKIKSMGQAASTTASLIHSIYIGIKNATKKD